MLISPKSLISDHSHTPFAEDHDVVLSILSLSSGSNWFNGLCCWLKFSHVSKSSSILISWLVPPHIEYRINLWLIIPVMIKKGSLSWRKFSCDALLASNLCFNSGHILIFRAILSWAPSICAMWIPYWLRLVMMSWLMTNGAATKPRASCGRAHMVELLGTRWYRG
jgi:hypothetical protein